MTEHRQWKIGAPCSLGWSERHMDGNNSKLPSEWIHRKRPKPFWVMSQISLSMTLTSRRNSKTEKNFRARLSYVFSGLTLQYLVHFSFDSIFKGLTKDKNFCFHLTFYKKPIGYYFLILLKKLWDCLRTKKSIVCSLNIPVCLSNYMYYDLRCVCTICTIQRHQWCIMYLPYLHYFTQKIVTGGGEQITEL